jgi:hypothetical protein
MSDIDLRDFHNWLLEVEKLSVSNTNAVLRVARKLVSGDGVQHKGRPGEVFRANEPVHLQTDMNALLRDASVWLPSSGPQKLDLGNGWGLRHPCKKLWLYQKYKATLTVSPYFNFPPDDDEQPSTTVETPKKQRIVVPVSAIVPVERSVVPILDDVLCASDEENFEIVAPLPTLSPQAQQDAFLGTNLKLMQYARNHYDKPGGMPTAAVRRYYTKFPNEWPNHLAGKVFGSRDGDVQVCHIVPDYLGGLAWPLNYGLYVCEVNHFFGKHFPLAWEQYVGTHAARTAAEFHRWHSRKAASMVTYSGYDPVTDFLLIRGRR